MSAKTEKRLTLEKIEEAIKQMCLKDAPNVSSITHLSQIVQSMSSYDSLNMYFDDQFSDLAYFVMHFTGPTLDNLLKKAFIPGNGDEAALELFISYASLFVKFKALPNYFSLWESIREVFNHKKPFYQPPQGQGFNKKGANPAKMMTCDEFNAKLIKLPEEMKQEGAFLIGDVIDVKVTQQKEGSSNSNELLDQVVWQRGLLVDKDLKGYKVSLPGESNLVLIERESVSIAPKGTLTLDYDWRVNLKEGDNVSCFDKNRYFASTIVKRNCIEFNGMSKVSYVIGYRIYLEDYPNWEDFSCYEEREISKDQTGRKYIGFPELNDEVISFTSKRLQKLNYVKKQFNPEEYYVDKFIPFINKNDQSTNLVVAREANFSYYYAQLIKKFFDKHPLDSLINIVKDYPIDADSLLTLLHIVNEISPFLHIEAIKQLSPTVKEVFANYLEKIQGNDLRNLKKESIDLMITIMSLYLPIGGQSQTECDQFLRKMLLDFSNRMIKTAILDKRLMSLKIITDMMKEIKESKEEMKQVIDSIYANGFISEIFGKNNHMQLIKSSSELIEHFSVFNKLTEEDFKTIWSLTQTSDHESKMAIIDLLKKNSASFNRDQINTVLHLIYLTPSTAVLNEEIDLIYFLSNDDNFFPSLEFLLKVLFFTSFEEKEKFGNLIIKISDFCKFQQKCKEKIYEECFSKLSTFTHSVHCLKMLQAAMMKNNVIEPFHKPTAAFKKNLEVFAQKAQGLNESSTSVIDEGCSYQVSIVSRLNFATFMLLNNIWLEEDLRIEDNNTTPSQKLITFLYSIFVERSVSPFHFFQWLINMLNKKVIVRADYPFLFDFLVKMPHQNFSKEAFDCFLRIFLDLNEISYSQRENIITTTNPIESIEGLKGFSTLSEITFTSNNEEIINQGINLIYLLYRNNPTWLLTKCFELLKSTNERESGIKKLRLLIDESEKNGTAGIKPHYAILKGKIISLQVNSSVSNSQFTLHLYSNTTIWEMRKIITKRVKISSDFLKIIVTSNQHEISNMENCKTLVDLKLKEGEEIALFYNNNLQLIPKAELLINNEMNPQLNVIFNHWFDIFSTDGKMLNTDCANFVKTVTGCKEDIKPQDSRVVSLFNQYDTKREGFITREEFLRFFSEAVMTPQKHFTVWENLNAMGIRNDLKTIEEDFFKNNLNKEDMLRYQLSQNHSLIETLLEINSPSSLTFLNYLCTNDALYKEMHEFNDANCLSNKNTTKLVYNLEIIQSFVENLEVRSNSGQVEEYLPMSDKSNHKAEWVQKLFAKNGFDTLIDLFHSITKETKESKECLNLIITILKDVFKSYFNQLEISQKIKDKLGEIITRDAHQKNNEPVPYSINENPEKPLIFSKEVNEKIEKYLNCNNLFQGLLLHLRIESFNPNAFELICILISFTKDEAAVLSSQFIPFSLHALKISTIQEEICISLIKLSYTNAINQRFCVIASLINALYDIISSIEESNERKEAIDTIFSLFSHLLEIYLCNKEKLSSLVKTDLNAFIYSIAQKISNDIHQEDNSKKINESIIRGYITTLSKAIQANDAIKEYISSNFDLIPEIYSVLFKKINLKLENISEDFVMPEKYNSLMNWLNEDPNTRKACYNLVLSLILSNEVNLEKFLANNLFSEVNCPQKDLIGSLSARECFDVRNENRVGITNLRCICYMNSIIQQFYMMPTLRYAVLQCDDKVERVEAKVNDVMIDDNTFHQIQRMFSYLDFSNRKAYDPLPFCYSFKDYEGNPTNINIQQDSNEFLCRFISTIEESFKVTKLKYIADSVFKGKQCVQIECSNCHSLRANYEEFSSLSLEVKNYKNIYESLDKYFSKDTIDDFNCEECKKKVQIIKKNSLGKCPNTVIIYLQRLLYDYEIEQNKKINSYFEFPKQLNLKKYAIESFSAGENDEIYFKSEDYYEYDLVGVNVHLGTAEQGHFFSYINATRSGRDNTMDFNEDSWLKFNDSEISKFNKDKLESECFGKSDSHENTLWANSQSAYMLFYERRTKSPLKVVIDPCEINKEVHEVVELTSENRLSIEKKYDYHYNQLISPDMLSEFQHILSSKVIFHDNERNEYYSFSPYYSFKQRIPKEFFYSIFTDNFYFHNTLNSKDEPFLKFYDAVFIHLFNNLSSLKDSIKEMVLKSFLNITSLILPYKDNLPYLQKAKELFMIFIKGNPSLFVLNVIMKYYCEFKVLFDNLLHENRVISQIHLDMMYEVVTRMPRESLFKEGSNDFDENSYTIQLMNCALKLFPCILPVFIQKVGPLGNFIRDVCFYNDDIMRYFIQSNCVCTFITFLIGRESPYYAKTIGPNHIEWDELRPYIIHFEAFVEILLHIYTNSSLRALVSKDDIEAFKCEGMLRYLFKNSPKLFKDYAVAFSTDNYDYTLMVCRMITKQIANLVVLNDLAEMIKVMESVLGLLETKDSYQMMRIHFLLGYPQLIIEDSNYPADEYNMPLMGYNLITDKTTQVYDLKSLYEEKGACCLLKKIVSLENKDLIAEAFLLMLKACQFNDVLYRFISSLPAEQMMYKSFIDYGYSMLSLSPSEKKKKDNVALFYEIMKGIKKEKKDGPQLVEYLIGDIKSEKISLLDIQDKYIILRYDYLAQINQYDDKLTFDQSRMSLKKKITNAGSLNKPENNDNANEFPSNPDEEEPIPQEVKNETTIELAKDGIYSSDQRIPREKEWILQLMPSLKAGLAVTVESQPIDKEAKYSYNLIRIVALNLDSKETVLSFSIDVKKQHAVNEHLPSHLIRTYLSASSAHTILTIVKIDPNAKWSFENEDSSCHLSLTDVKYETEEENERGKFNTDDMKYDENYFYEEEEDYF